VDELKISKQYNKILDIIKSCFLHSDLGRRPRNLWIERRLKDFVVFGHELLEWYISQTNDIGCFPEVDKRIDIFHLQGIIEGLIDHGWNDREDKEIIRYISVSIECHSNFYLKWIEAGIESFLSNFDETFVHRLLELYEDTDFFRILTSISKIKNEKTVNIINHYKDDEEFHIREFIKKLQINIF
jgi:hypothetical protein